MGVSDQGDFFHSLKSILGSPWWNLANLVTFYQLGISIVKAIRRYGDSAAIPKRLDFRLHDLPDWAFYSCLPLSALYCVTLITMGGTGRVVGGLAGLLLLVLVVILRSQGRGDHLVLASRSGFDSFIDKAVGAWPVVERCRLGIHNPSPTALRDPIVLVTTIDPEIAPGFRLPVRLYPDKGEEGDIPPNETRWYVLVTFQRTADDLHFRFFFNQGASTTLPKASSHKLAIAAGSGLGISIKGKVRLWVNGKGQPRAKIL